MTNKIQTFIGTNGTNIHHNSTGTGKLLILAEEKNIVQCPTAGYFSILLNAEDIEQYVAKIVKNRLMAKMDGVETIDELLETFKGNLDGNNNL